MQRFSDTEAYVGQTGRTAVAKPQGFSEEVTSYVEDESGNGFRLVGPFIMVEREVGETNGTFRHALMNSEGVMQEKGLWCFMLEGDTRRNIHPKQVLR